MTAPLTPTTRELACLALGHEDADEPRCASTDEDLVRQLVEEVQALRFAAGLIEETDLDRQQQREAIRGAVGPFASPVRAERILAALTADGWTLHQVRRP